MKQTDFLAEVGLRIQKDAVGLWKWRVGAQMSLRIRRFNAFIEEVL
jgi:hypothetical protein